MLITLSNCWRHLTDWFLHLSIFILSDLSVILSECKFLVESRDFLLDFKSSLTDMLLLLQTELLFESLRLRFQFKCLILFEFAFEIAERGQLLRHLWHTLTQILVFGDKIWNLVTTHRLRSIQAQLFLQIYHFLFLHLQLTLQFYFIYFIPENKYN